MPSTEITAVGFQAAAAAFGALSPQVSMNEPERSWQRASSSLPLSLSLDAVNAEPIPEDVQAAHIETRDKASTQIRLSLEGPRVSTGRPDIEERVSDATFWSQS